MRAHVVSSGSELFSSSESTSGGVAGESSVGDGGEGVRPGELASEDSDTLPRVVRESDSDLTCTSGAVADADADLEFEPVHILAVSHGGLIGTLVTNLLGSRKLREGEGVVVGRCFNASISVVDLYEDGKGVLVSYADTTHLNVDLVVKENADVARE